MTEQIPIYELSINIRAIWHAHSLSNDGSNGSNRLFPRRQMLSEGIETDACSGNIAKHHHAILLAEYLQEDGLPLCAACAVRDGRRAAGLIGREGYQDLTIERILRECALCDAHGFLVTPKNGNNSDKTESRQRMSKHSLIEFSFALAVPSSMAQTVQLMTRAGESKEEGQMLMKMPARSGSYAFNVRYKSVGIGVNTDKWTVVLNDEQQRLQRHKAILFALRDQILSPSGALTTTMLPHLTDLVGAIVVRRTAGRAAICSALKEDFIEQLIGLKGAMDYVIQFRNIDDFCAKMNWLIHSSYPYLPRNHQDFTQKKVSSEL